METRSEPHRQGFKIKAGPIVTTALAAIGAAAVVIALFSTRPAPAYPIRIPPGVNAQTCSSVARHAGVYAKDMTAKRLGEYYAAWVERFEQHVGAKVMLTRTNLFDAGLAVSVCLR